MQLFSNALKVSWPSDWHCFSQYCVRSSCGVALTARGTRAQLFLHLGHRPSELMLPNVSHVNPCVNDGTQVMGTQAMVVCDNKQCTYHWHEYWVTTAA